jgi:hypothetical protein
VDPVPVLKTVTWPLVSSAHPIRNTWWTGLSKTDSWKQGINSMEVGMCRTNSSFIHLKTDLVGALSQTWHYHGIWVDRKELQHWMDGVTEGWMRQKRWIERQTNRQMHTDAWTYRWR